MRPEVAYLLLIVITLVLLGATVGYGWRHRHAPGGARFSAFVAAAWCWAFLVGAMAIADPATARLLLGFKYVAIGIAPLASFLFVAQRTGRLTRLSWGQLAAALVVPVTAALLSFRDGAGMVAGVQFGRADQLTYTTAITFGPVYWLFTAFGYTLTIGSIAFLLVARRDREALSRTQAAPLLIGILAPLVTNALLITGIAPREFDPMPFGLAISAICIWRGAFHGRILDLVPVARHLVVDSLQEGILIVDREHRVLDVNAHFARIAGIEAERVIGRTLEECATIDAALCAVVARVLFAAEVSHPAAPAPDATPRANLQVGERSYDVRVLVVADRDANPEARVVVLQDVTERQRWEDEQGRLIAQLQDALAQVKTLTGLLPICSGCKRIRDDDGTWQNVETFIRDRTDAEFSHGMCPTCVQRWYPELHPSTRG